MILLGRGDADARERRRRVEPRAVLHAGDQPVREARRSHPRQRRRARVSRRRRPHAAAGLRGLRGHRASSGTAPATTASSSSCRSTRRTAPTRTHQQSAYFTTRREPRLVSPAAEAPRPALELHRQRGLPVAGRSGAGAVQRRPAPARRSRRCAPIAIWCCRCRSASARPTSRSTSPRRSTSIRVDQRAEPSVRAAGRRRRRLAGDQPPVAQLPVAGERDAAARARRRCAICSSSTRRAPTSARGGRSRASGRCSVGRVVRRLPGAGPARVRPRPRDHRRRRRAGVRRRQRVPARVRCSIDTSRATCRSTRSPRRCCARESRGEINRWAPHWGTRPTL